MEKFLETYRGDDSDLSEKWEAKWAADEKARADRARAKSEKDAKIGLDQRLRSFEATIQRSVKFQEFLTERGEYSPDLQIAIDRAQRFLEAMKSDDETAIKAAKAVLGRVKPEDSRLTIGSKFAYAKEAGDTPDPESRLTVPPRFKFGKKPPEKATDDDPESRLTVPPKYKYGRKKT